MAQERWLVIANCQTLGLANSLQSLVPDVEVTGMYPHSFNNAPLRNNRTLAQYDRLFISPGIEKMIPRARLERIKQHTMLPWFSFRAYHPDLVYAQCGGVTFKSPADDYHSGIALAAYRKGMSLADTRELYRGRTFEICGLFGWWQSERDRIVDHLHQIGIDITHQIRRWGDNDAFMYSTNHPKIRVLFDLAKELVKSIGREPLANVTMPHDNLAYAGGFAVYPEIGESLGVPGSYIFKTYDTYRQFGLDEFLAGSFAMYDRYPREALGVTGEFRQTFEQIERAL